LITVQNNIGTYQEYSLHEALKNNYKTENGETEVKIDKFIVDVVNEDQLIEIQTKNFSQIREKLVTLLTLGHKMTLVHPIYVEKVFKSRIDNKLSIRTSPKKDNLLTIFNELIYIPELFHYDNFSLEIVFTKVEIERKKIRNKYKNIDKKLLEIKRTVKFSSIDDLLFIIPYDLQSKLTTKKLMQRLDINYALASKIVYFFSKTNILKMIEKQGNLKIYSVKIDK